MPGARLIGSRSDHKHLADFGNLFGEATYALGLIAIVISFPLPEIIAPFAMGVEMDPSLWKAYSFQRALYGLVASGVIGVVVTLFTAPKDPKSLVGLIAGSIKEARSRFKGSDNVKESAGPKTRVALQPVERDEVETLESGTPLEFSRNVVWATRALLAKLEAEPGDLLNIMDFFFFFFVFFEF